MQFFDLWSRASRTPEAHKPITPAQTKLLKELIRHPAWELYVKALDRYSIMLAEQLLVQPDPNRLIDLRAEIRGLRNAPLLVAQAIQSEELNDEQRRTVERAFAPDSGERAFDAGPYANRSTPDA